MVVSLVALALCPQRPFNAFLLHRDQTGIQLAKVSIFAGLDFRVCTPQPLETQLVSCWWTSVVLTQHGLQTVPVTDIFDWILADKVHSHRTQNSANFKTLVNWTPVWSRCDLPFSSDPDQTMKNVAFKTAFLLLLSDRYTALLHPSISPLFTSLPKLQAGHRKVYRVKT